MLRGVVHVVNVYEESYLRIREKQQYGKFKEKVEVREWRVEVHFVLFVLGSGGLVLLLIIYFILLLLHLVEVVLVNAENA